MRPQLLTRLATSRLGGIASFLVLFVAVSTITRIALLVQSQAAIAWDWSLASVFTWGLIFDLGAGVFAALPVACVLALLPREWGSRAWQRIVTTAAGVTLTYVVLFGAVSEWLFWDEFAARFNFIAVDYLVYTNEVVGNIQESYPLPLILGALGVGAVVVHWLMRRSGLSGRWQGVDAGPLRTRVRAGGIWIACCVGVGFALDSTRLPAFENNYNRELAKNGLWSLVAAFRNNELDYPQFYAVLSDDAAFARLQQDLVEDGSILLRPGGRDTLRYVLNTGPELRPNVIQITVESLSADFLSIFNRASGLSPNLEAIAAKSLVFDRFYASGTRTDRGMEALALSLPPTPGRSMIKRPRNENMFTLGSVFRSKGYDTAFIYGGFGYFDNMNYFFGNNGYRVVDRNDAQAGDITFANTWGACDEDLYRWTAREADASYASGKPFHFFVMTTSNHRPYTYPEGKIDLPPKVSGRDGAVKYTDFAIGEFLRDVESKPWFKNTVFVIVADHTASVAGKTALPIQNYHIPLIIFAPGGHVAPGRVRTLTSQIDYGPTLFGLLNWSYATRFFGHDIRKIDPAEAHALVGNYQKLGHLEDGVFQVLSPLKDSDVQGYDLATGKYSAHADDAAAEAETVSYYQSASYMYRHDLYRALSAEDIGQSATKAATIVAGRKGGSSLRR